MNSSAVNKEGIGVINKEYTRVNKKKMPDGILTQKPLSLYAKLRKGLNDISLGNTRPFAEAMDDVKVKRSK